MGKEPPLEVVLKSSELIKTIISSVRCLSCSRIICEPQTGICKHDACAKCWASSGRTCSICKTDSGGGLLPNVELSQRVDCIIKLAKSFQEWSKIDVLSNKSSNETEIFTQKDNVNECFYEKDKKYTNTKTYKGKTKIGQPKINNSLNDTENIIEEIYDCPTQKISNDKDLSFKVGNWLHSPDNIFTLISEKNLSSSKKANKSMDHDNLFSTNNISVFASQSDSNLENKIDVEEKKTHNKSNESAPSRLEKQKTEWVDVNKCKKTFRKIERRSKKKLSVSVQKCANVSSPVKLINEETQPTDIYEVLTECNDKIVDQIPAKKDEYQLIEIDEDKNKTSDKIAENFQIENTINAKLNLTMESTQIQHSLDSKIMDLILKDIKSNTFKNHVPFTKLGKLAPKKKLDLENRASVQYQYSSKSYNSFGINVKIKQEENSISIVIPNQFLKQNSSLTKTVYVQTDSDLFKCHECVHTSPFQNKLTSVKVPSISCNFSNFSDNIDENIFSKIKNKSISATSFSSTKRPRDESSRSNFNNSNPVKKNKLSVSEMPEDKELVVNFESLITQINTEETVNKPSSDMSLCESSSNNALCVQSKGVSDITNDPKLMAVKKSVEMYTGNADNESPLNKEDAVESNLQTFTNSQTRRFDEPCTPQNVSEHFNDIVIEDTPQKSKVTKIIKRSLTRNSSTKENVDILHSNNLDNRNSQNSRKLYASKETSNSDMDETIICDSRNQIFENKFVDSVAPNKIITPSSINKFKHDVKHQSTPLQPLARKSLTYDNIEKCSVIAEEDESIEKQIMSKSRLTHTQSLLEMEFIKEALEPYNEKVTPEIEKRKCLRSFSHTNKIKSSNVIDSKTNKKSSDVKICCSLLDANDRKFVLSVSAEMGWDFQSNFSENLSHLIVKVDKNNRTNRTEKYIRALAMGCWIVSLDWVKECERKKSLVAEDAFEVLGNGGERGPYLMRTSKEKLFRDITFYIQPPIQMLPVNVVNEIVSATGGKFVKDIKEIYVKDPNKISIVIAEPKDTQESALLDICMKHPVVPINVEWILDCLGKGKLDSLLGWLLVPRNFLPNISWPADLISESNDSICSQ